MAGTINRYGIIAGRKPGGSDGFAERVALFLEDFSRPAQLSTRRLPHSGSTGP